MLTEQKYLITPTLLNAFLFYQKDNREEATEEFLKTLNKEFKMTEAIQRGIEFEDEVRACSELMEVTNTKIEVHEEISNIVKDIAEIVKNGLWQVVLQKEVEIDNTKYLLYGKADVIKENFIYDIKTTNKYDIGKYQDSMQHRIYMYCSNIKNFQYLICENDKNFFIEDYTFNKNTEMEIITCINDFINFIKSNETFLNIFNKKWKSNY